MAALLFSSQAGECNRHHQQDRHGSESRFYHCSHVRREGAVVVRGNLMERKVLLRLSLSQSTQLLSGLPGRNFFFQLSSLDKGWISHQLLAKTQQSTILTRSPYSSSQQLITLERPNISSLRSLNPPTITLFIELTSHLNAAGFWTNGTIKRTQCTERKPSDEYNYTRHLPFKIYNIRWGMAWYYVILSSQCLMTRVSRQSITYTY